MSEHPFTPTAKGNCIACHESERAHAALSAAPAPRAETQVTIGARMARAIAQWREGPDTEGKHAEADLDDAGEIEEYMRRNGLRVSLIEPSIENCPTCGADDDAESDTCPDGWHWHTPAPAWPSADDEAAVEALAEAMWSMGYSKVPWSNVDGEMQAQMRFKARGSLSALHAASSDHA